MGRLTSLSSATADRVQILELRLRLEQAAMDAYHLVSEPERMSYAQKVEERLPFLFGLVDGEDYLATHGLIRLARHVYSRTSDILHGRSTMLEAPAIILDEWKEVVAGVEKVVIDFRARTPNQ
ncbi:hypothetical protein, partial [Streptomyces zingiberis]